MSEVFFYLIKDLSKDENLAISYFFYKICLGVESFSSYEECQVLYNALVHTLGLESHSEKVIAAVNQNTLKLNCLRSQTMILKDIRLICAAILKSITRKILRFMINAIIGVPKL